MFERKKIGDLGKFQVVDAQSLGYGVLSLLPKLSPAFQSRLLKALIS